MRDERSKVSPLRILHRQVIDRPRFEDAFISFFYQSDSGQRAMCNQEIELLWRNAGQIDKARNFFACRSLAPGL
jgi:hypothetical protein